MWRRVGGGWLGDHVRFIFTVCSSLHLTFSSFFHIFIFKSSLAMAFSTAGFFFLPFSQMLL